MKPWVATMLASGALFAGAWQVAPRTERSLTELARPIAAPLTLPFLWVGLAEATRREAPEEVIARGRVLLGLLPCWPDGYLHLAHPLAFDAADNTTLDVAVDRLMACLALLDEARERCPGEAAEYHLAQAFFAEQRGASSPEFADRFHTRTGTDPLEAADRYLELAERADPESEAIVRKAFLTVQMIGLALRNGDVTRALATLDRADEALGQLEAGRIGNGLPATRENARAHRTSLARLRATLPGDPAISAKSLRADRYLEDITVNLPTGR